MKPTLFTTILLAILLSSCNVLKNKNKAPNYIEDASKREVMLTSQPIPLGADSSKTLIVYNVVEQEEKKFKITDETIRLLIADFFGTLTTIITVWQMQGQ